MILINLLPHREERRRRRKQAFFAGMGLAGMVGLLLAGMGYLVLIELTSSQLARNQYLQTEIGRLERQIRDIASLKTEIEALKARQKVVEDFQIDRNMPVHLLNELSRQTPEGVYLSSVKQEGQLVTVTGLAQTNERVAELLRNTAYQATWLEKPELVEIRLAPVAAGQRDAKRLFEFAMRVTLKRPQDQLAPRDPVRPVPAGASAPAPARPASAS